MNSNIVLIDCPEDLGIVHKVTGVLYRHRLNVEEQREFVDHSNSHFFMRTEVSGEVNHARVLDELRQAIPQANIRLNEPRKKRIVIFVTSEPHCLGDLLIRHDYGELNAEILAVVSNRESLQPLVEKFAIPFHYVSHEGHDRCSHEERICSVLSSYSPEYLVLAKYMRVFTDKFVAQYTDRMINIHHSFLPAFIGSRPYHQAHDRGVKIIGATAHYVTAELDEGPIIAQDVTTVDHSKSLHEMIAAGRNVEKIVLANALRLVFEDRVFMLKNRTIVFG